MHEGPIPFFIHGALDYLAGALLIVAPFLLSFDSGSATAVSIVGGVLVLVVAAATDGPTSLTNSIPVSVHALLDLVAGGVFIAAPFLFGFSNEGPPTAFFIGLGVLYVLIVVGTRYPRRARSEPLPDEGALDPDA